MSKIDELLARAEALEAKASALEAKIAALEGAEEAAVKSLVALEEAAAAGEFDEADLLDDVAPDEDLGAFADRLDAEAAELEGEFGDDGDGDGEKGYDFDVVDEPPVAAPPAAEVKGEFDALTEFELLLSRRNELST